VLGDKTLWVRAMGSFFLNKGKISRSGFSVCEAAASGSRHGPFAYKRDKALIAFRRLRVVLPKAEAMI
jgi:hypothetical protein